MSKDCPDCKKAEEYKKYVELSKQNMHNPQPRKRIYPGTNNPGTKETKR